MRPDHAVGRTDDVVLDLVPGLPEALRGDIEHPQDLEQGVDVVGEVEPWFPFYFDLAQSGEKETSTGNDELVATSPLGDEPVGVLLREEERVANTSSPPDPVKASSRSWICPGRISRTR